MSKHYDLTKPPKFIVNFFMFFRKWKLGRYKKKKVRKERTIKNRTYYVKFSVKIDDPKNPQEQKREYNMMVPAKAAFFAKRKALLSIKKKMSLNFSECELMTDDDLEYMEKTREEYLKKKESN